MAENKKEKKLYTLKQYKCGYCGYVFRWYLRRVKAYGTVLEDARHTYSTPVQCSYCKNMLRSWGEGEIIGEYEDKDKKRLVVNAKK